MRRLILAVACLAALSACEQESSVVRAIQKQETAEMATASDFMAQAREKPGVQVTASGLAYEIVTPSSDQSLPMPTADAVVLAHYEGTLPDGQVFDSSFSRGQPAEFPLSRVIPGWTEGLQHVRPGDEVIFYIPPELGYGPAGSPPRIPPNSALKFRIQLLAVAFPDGRIVYAPGLSPEGGN